MIVADTDLPAHVRIAKEMNENGKLFSGNFLMCFLMNFMTFFRVI